MKRQKVEKRHKAPVLVILGFVVIIATIILYSKYQDSQYVTPNAVDNFIRMAYAFYLTLILALGSIGIGLYRYHKQKVEEAGDDLFSIIATITWNSKSRRIFVATFITYGIFFSLTSGTLVYQPDIIFSYHYGVDVPSAQISPCCDVPGYMPKILVYLTEHVGLQIIPVNLILQIIVSYLVGLNMSIAISAISISKKGRSIGGIGATTGLFIACPTCVGTFLSLFIGTASGIALSLALIQLQTLFIAITIPVLLATPFILAKKLRDSNQKCNV